MDKEQARFILRCFRPDGADAADPEFAAALRLATEDRELGEWLANERAKDAGFSQALERLALPDGLRQEILAGLEAARGAMPQADEFDAPMIGALAALRPPVGLREEILAAMRVSAPTATRAGRRGWGWWALGAPLAAAAGIVLAVYLNPAAPPTGLADSPVLRGAVPISLVENQAIEVLASPDFSLDLNDPDHETLFRFIRKAGRMCPEGSLPDKLKGVPGLGCCTIEVDGMPGAIVCFRRGPDDVVHLLVFRRDEIEGELPDRAHPIFEQKGGWAVARWEDRGRALFLIGNTSIEHLDEAF